MTRGQLVLISATFLSLASCSPDSAINFNLGQALPGFAYEVTFEEPVLKRDLFRDLRSTFREEGFQEITTAMFDSMQLDSEPVSGRVTFAWEKDDDSTGFDYIMYSSWYPREGLYASEVDIRLNRNSSHKSFTLEEWKLCARWLAETLPNALDGGTVTLSHHPSRFTDKGDLSAFSEASGLKLRSQAP